MWQCTIITCNGEHGLSRARGETSRGHIAIREELDNMAISVDADAETEPQGLIA